MIPNLIAEVERAKKAFPEAWANAHTSNAHFLTGNSAVSA